MEYFYYKTTCNCNMRTRAGSYNDLVCTVPVGEVVSSNDIIDFYHGAPWVFVHWNGNEGWINDLFLKEIK